MYLLNDLLNTINSFAFIILLSFNEMLIVNVNSQKVVKEMRVMFMICINNH